MRLGACVYGEGCPEGTAPPDAVTVAAATIKQTHVSLADFLVGNLMGRKL